MRAFVACAKVTAMTLVTLYGAFFVFATVWTFAFSHEFTTLAFYGIRWVAELATITAGLVSGYFASRFEPVYPYLTATITAVLVEALLASTGGGFRMQPLWQTLAAIAAGVALALFVVWARGRLRPPVTES